MDEKEISREGGFSQERISVRAQPPPPTTAQDVPVVIDSPARASDLNVGGPGLNSSIRDR